MLLHHLLDGIVETSKGDLAHLLITVMIELAFY